VALVFGPERGGLSAGELRSCQLLLAVPTNPDFPVLNLAQAVAAVLAILPHSFSLPVPRSDVDLPAHAGDFQAALAHLSAALLETGYLDPVNPSRIEDQLRRLFGRAAPTARELAILRGIASHITYLHRRGAGV
jgi:tRNA C32,U32 (ribose-2'-O)-methylase TrmJ